MGDMKTISRRMIAGIAIGALLLVVGCSNAQTVQQRDPEDSQTQTFNAEFRKVVDVAAASLRQIRFEVREIIEDDEAATIHFIRPGGFTNYGGVGRMIVKKSPTPPITVMMQYERRVALSAGAGEQSLAKNIFGRMEREIQFSGPKS
jgi:outer membrane murein-binding lipoprotein Lpp